MDSGTVDQLVKSGLISGSGGDHRLLRKKPGKTKSDVNLNVTHVAVDAPVLHLVNAGDASESVKFKAGAELSKSAN